VRAKRGFDPIFTPIGNHTSVATMTNTTTREKVTSPSHSGVQNTARPSSTFCRTVSHGRSAKVWKTIAVPAFGPVKGWFRNATEPAEGAMSPAMHRNNVDLPLPDLPRRATISPALTLSDTPSSTGNGPSSVSNVLVT
jgi:hypothetical protein